MWQSIEDLLHAIKKEKYVFLRNDDNISDYFDENDDWDVLCENIDVFVRACEAKSVRGSQYNFYTNINGKRLLLDIRTVGDGYYDEHWEQDILKKREIKKNIFVLDNTNKIYCTLYHALLQKNKDGALKYKDYIQKELGIYELEMNIKQLAVFMCQNGYNYATPKDIGVYNNELNVKKLIREIGNG